MWNKIKSALQFTFILAMVGATYYFFGPLITFLCFIFGIFGAVARLTFALCDLVA